MYNICVRVCVCVRVRVRVHVCACVQIFKKTAKEYGLEKKGKVLTKQGGNSQNSARY